MQRTPEEADRLARRLAARFRMVNWIWIGLSVLQLGTAFGAIAALWNLWLTGKRWRMARAIEDRRLSAVQMYEGSEGSFLTWALVNLFLGGVVGAGVVVYEYLFIRGPIMANRALFTATRPRGLL